MDWKNFLRPNLVKIILCIALFLISTLFSNYFWLMIIDLTSGPFDSMIVGTTHGFPLPFYANLECFSCNLSEMNVEMISYPTMLIDIIFWYIIACSIYRTYEKHRS